MRFRTEQSWETGLRVLVVREGLTEVTLKLTQRMKRRWLHGVEEGQAEAEHDGPKARQGFGRPGGSPGGWK